MEKRNATRANSWTVRMIAHGQAGLSTCEVSFVSSRERLVFGRRAEGFLVSSSLEIRYVNKTHVGLICFVCLEVEERGVEYLLHRCPERERYQGYDDA